MMCCCCIRRKISSMVQSGHRFSLPFVIRESLKIAAAISVLLVSALYISNNVGKFGSCIGDEQDRRSSGAAGEPHPVRRDECLAECL